ncbi:calcium uptake protein 2, mitochondrial isoform X2 [Latimeria chalumnae]|uniref:calcium uptake protein 2, mitochondrial isoform X2 n=1 Tax=Latimeria chalumnae TaxID=7897 RepID=UPI00313EC933
MATWKAAVASLQRLGVGFCALRAAVSRSGLRPGVLGVVLFGGGVAYYCAERARRSNYLFVYAQEAQNKDVSSYDIKEIPSIRKQRFQQFASLTYKDEWYMTPRDFLYSVLLEQSDQPNLKGKGMKPDENGAGKLEVKKLTDQVDSMLGKAANAKSGPAFFRDLGDDGLISYTEYLFLLTILTKPCTGFRMAFKMLDTDGNEQVEKREFLKLQSIIGNRNKVKLAQEGSPAHQEATMKRDHTNTTLLVHFFGRAGKEKFHYRDFHRFTEDLQTEVQEMEFIQFSKGMNTMRREDFAEWLLFFTNEEHNDVYWQNVRQKIPPGESITFEEFRSFCQFTNHLEDFAITMKMFSQANRPVKLAEFRRAVKVATGQELSKNVLDTVFKIFDVDGDNCLSHQEFLGVIKDRLHRGLRVAQQQGVQGYWRCVKRETIKAAKEVWKQTGQSPF